MIQMVKTRGDLPDKVEPGTVKFLLHFEGCMPLAGSIHNLRNFYRLGLRSLQPVWNFRNELGDGVWENRTGGGLTHFGVEVIKEANRLGMVVDLSHMNREGFFQSLDAAQRVNDLFREAAHERTDQRPHEELLQGKDRT